MQKIGGKEQGGTSIGEVSAGDVCLFDCRGLSGWLSVSERIQFGRATYRWALTIA